MTTTPTDRPAGSVDPKLLEILVCPLTKGPLEYDAAAQELISRSAKLAYPIRDGIPIMLPEEAAGWIKPRGRSLPAMAVSPEQRIDNQALPGSSARTSNRVCEWECGVVKVLVSPKTVQIGSVPSSTNLSSIVFATPV